jgi:hypothetical protein
MNELPAAVSPRFELCYRSLFRSGRGFSFPCDAQGRVDIASLSDRARNNYLFCRATVGREVQLPAVTPAHTAQYAAY